MADRSSQPVALEAKDLCVVQGSFRLGPISLCLRSGDYLMLMGPSGSGKTTLLKTLAGILPLTAGTIHINGVNITQLTSHTRQVGYVPQHSLLFPHLTVAANVRFGLPYCGDSKGDRESRFAEVVELAGIDGLLSRFPGTLSGGEARRVALARALAVRPFVLLLDEPLSMLDVEARDGLLGALRVIRDRAGVVILHVTHQQAEAQAVATRSAMLQAGRLMAEDSRTPLAGVT